MNTKAIFVLLCVTVSTCWGNHHNHRPLDGRIVGGEPVDIKDYPYQASFTLDTGDFCGGSIINSRYILTAAHCTDGIQNPRDIIVRVGSSKRESGGMIVQNVAIHQHPRFDPDTLDYDVSILELAIDLPMREGIRTINLPDEDLPLIEGMLATATGFGRLSADGPLPSVLQKVELPVVTTETCQRIYGKDQVTERMFCAGFAEEHKDTCQGDSGGPLAVDGVVIGIVSWGFGCAELNQPGAYTKVSEVRDFINSILNN